MGHRLSRIYTRTGDAGTTGLGDGKRVDKDHPRVEAMGDVDELNCVIGLMLTTSVPEDIADLLTDVQHTLFDLGGELSIPGYTMVTDDRVVALEAALDRLNDELEPLKEFILPGGTEAASYCHLARAVCRRAERRLVTLARTDGVSEAGRRYLNRLSDLLFVLARSLNHRADRPDVLWRHDRAKARQSRERS